MSTHFVKSRPSRTPDQQGFPAIPAKPTKRRSVESDAEAAPHGAADGHERAKDFLTEGEVKRLLDAAKAGRHGVRDHLLLFMMCRQPR